MMIWYVNTPVVKVGDLAPSSHKLDIEHPGILKDLYHRAPSSAFLSEPLEHNLQNKCSIHLTMFHDFHPHMPECEIMTAV